jgi:hypothetical protein
VPAGAGGIKTWPSSPSPTGGEFGDTDPLGWATTVAYFIVAAMCFRAARVARRRGNAPVPVLGQPPPGPAAQDRPTDWLVIAAGVFLLGLNKQLDVQILARDAGLRLVTAAGFDAQRRWVGRAMFLCLSGAVVWVLARSANHLRRARRGHTLTLAGLAFLASFLVIRATGYQPFFRDVNLRFKDVLHVVLELGGLAFLGASAWRSSASSRPPPQLEHQ